jgi:hypothetical protein
MHPFDSKLLTLKKLFTSWSIHLVLNKKDLPLRALKQIFVIEFGKIYLK